MALYLALWADIVLAAYHLLRTLVYQGAAVDYQALARGMGDASLHQPSVCAWVLVGVQRECSLSFLDLLSNFRVTAFWAKCCFKKGKPG